MNMDFYRNPNTEIFKKVSALRYYHKYGMDSLLVTYPLQEEFINNHKDLNPDTVEDFLLLGLKTEIHKTQRVL